MTDQILLRFLRAGLIDVGGDDAKLEKLLNTAADLADVLQRAPLKAASYALIAFDPDAPHDDPVVREAADALQKRWATYANTFSGTPVAVLRAVLLDAIVQAANGDDKIAVALVTSAKNALPFMEVANERAIWVDAIENIEQRIDARAEHEWATPEALNVPGLNFPLPDAIEIDPSTPGKIDKAALAKKIEAAAGPNNTAGHSTGGNPHWPNSPQNWITEFANRLADAIIEASGTAAKGTGFEPIDLSGPLNDLAQAVSAHVDTTLRAVSGATAGLQRRTNLIWWKLALYSPSARLTYRGMSTSSAAALMAFDLHRQVPTFSPASVAAFSECP